MHDLTVAMPTKVGAATAAWPFGEPRNVTAPGDGTGTPWREDLGKDLIGFAHFLALEGGITPNNVSDTALASQIVEGLKAIIRAFPDMNDVIFNNKLTLSGGFEYPAEQDVTGLTGSNNDVALTNAEVQAVFKIVATDALTFTGIAAPDTVLDARIRVIKRSGGLSFTLTNEDAFSTAANRMVFADGNDVVVADGEFITLMYNPNLARWELLSRSVTPGLLRAPDIVLQDQKSTTTDGGTFTAGTQTRVLNTEVRDVNGDSSLSSNQFTLDAGSYYLRATAPGYQVNRHRMSLYNATAASTIESGLNAESGAVSDATTRAHVDAVFTIAAGQALEIRHFAETTSTTRGFGLAISDGATEIYTQVEIWRVA